jgi:hypothetical protein
MPEMFSSSVEIRQAFVKYDRQVIINNVKVGCLVGALLMPLGTFLDYFVYREDLSLFVELRHLV